ncbi:uncharacterized protein ASCRUDRAFT_131527 [Ascoidea rubescens DSM 1968]|uniref:Uncharacterized protein n=1 Tax=Ascoidea rubescens DSM 1968 TaxID=1344418 RepID=A0A1D2V8G8_9ASCO|nr:hypothetical protein ASCRUDRAFT_131527 [Ascoidea rubescens DSM 1968]ODV57898.1 hypothetical protein ASCRUDRAFT_131527 [Ascoidea rubescens DSM 1968]
MNGFYFSTINILFANQVPAFFFAASSSDASSAEWRLTQPTEFHKISYRDATGFANLLDSDAFTSGSGLTTSVFVINDPFNQPNR